MNHVKKWSENILLLIMIAVGMTSLLYLFQSGKDNHTQDHLRLQEVRVEVVDFLNKEIEQDTTVSKDATYQEALKDLISQLGRTETSASELERTLKEVYALKADTASKRSE